MGDKLSVVEIQNLAKQLKKLKAGFLPYAVFVEIARLVVLSIIEFVPLRLNEKGDPEVLLLLRGDDDPIWPGVLHTPGTVVRPTDTERKINLAFERILTDELKGTATSAPHYVGSNLHKSKRGMEQAQIYWVEILEDPKIGQFYAANDLPGNIMESQVTFIQQAVQNYKDTLSRT